ncbi:MAG: MFS transporter [Desulfamplus sp.]|nr:MFS transporter [Desulfamplus sp.]
MNLTKEEKSWILYDVGNSAFVLVMVTAIMPIFFKDYASKGVADAVSTANWGFANSAASLILALLSPVLGTLADYKDRKMHFFIFFLCMGLIFNSALVFVQEGMWLTSLVFFVFARTGWAGSNLFYDAAIMDVTSGQDRIDHVSSMGYAWGYIGSVIPFLLIIALIMGTKTGSDSGTLPVFQTKVGFLIVALWWAAFSIPMIRNVKQHNYLPPSPSPVSESFRRLAGTFQEIRTSHRRAFVFLAAYFFYIDGVGTIISMSSAYGRDLGFSVTLLIVVILFIQLVAFPFALLYGRLSRIFSTQNMIMAGIIVYCVIACIAFALPSITDSDLQIAAFWFIAFLVASSMGGLQALSRSYFATLIPPEKSGEFFGFYNVFGKFAAITGPFVMGAVGSITGETRWGVLALLLLFIAGALLLRKVE